MAADDPVVEEAWNLVNNFYLDRSFNGLDWPDMRRTFGAQAAKDGSFSAAREMIKGLGDKYTRLLDRDTYAKLSRFDVVGAGALFSANEDGELAIASPPISGSPAEKAGVQKGDLVLGINGKPSSSMSAFDVIDFLISDPSPTVTLRLQSIATGEERSLELVRQVAQVKDPVSFRKLGSHTGYIRIAEFNALAPARTKAALKDLALDSADRFILDLRGNPGGTFQTAINIAGALMDDTVVTYAVDGFGDRTEFRTPKEEQPISTTAPIVVLTDRRTASASEVLTGALRDNCRALVVGDRSFGKGLVQGVFGLQDGSGLVLTVAKYQTPSGLDINGIGIKPNVQKDQGLGGVASFLGVTSDEPEEEWALAAQLGDRAQDPRSSGFCVLQ